MAHITSKSYHALQKRLDEAPQGAPASESLFKILEVLFTEEEAGKVSILPINLFTIEEASQLWKKPNDETRRILDTLADKGILFDFTAGETQAYLLAPPLAGFFEFSLRTQPSNHSNSCFISFSCTRFVRVIRCLSRQFWTIPSLQDGL